MSRNRASGLAELHSLRHDLNLNSLNLAAHGRCRSDACFGSAVPLGCALAALWAAPAAAADLRPRSRPTRSSSAATFASSLSTARRAGSMAASASCARAATAIFACGPQLGNVNLVWKPQFTWSLRRDRRRLAPGRRAHRSRAQPGLSDLQADARRQARFLGPRRPDVAAGQPRA